MKKILRDLKLLIMDVDGVLTDGKIICTSKGEEIKMFDVHDGYGIHRCRKAGIKTAIISARFSKPVAIRAKDLRIDFVLQDSRDKLAAYKKLLQKLKLEDKEVCFIGDDLLDMPVLSRVGFSVAVNNAVSDLKRNVDYVTKASGGNGAVREVIERIIKAKGKN